MSLCDCEVEGCLRMGEVGVSVSSEERNSGKDEVSSSEDVVRWEKFLPKMVLRVLLVEADDSTRQIIAALLRKCSYKVSAVPDGLKAWETLKEKPHNIDLVLTELDLPSISGYALLTLITEDDACKNIPVIMMSSCNTMNMVLKCMLKGAADFLIKPVRKNELRNLWQHVWRRQNVAAGTATENRKNVLHSAEATSENNEASNPSSGCVAFGEKIKDISERKSDEQDFSKYNPGSVSNLNSDGDFKQDRGLVVPNNFNREVPNCNHPCNLSEANQACTRTMTRKGNTDTESCRRDPGITRQAHNERFDSSSGAIDFVSTFDSHQEGPSVHTTLRDKINKQEFAPQLELSLRRFCPLDQGNTEALNHSDYSPFSRYNDGKTLSSLSLVPANEHTQVKERESESDQILSVESLEFTNEFSEIVKKDKGDMSDMGAEMALLPAHQLGPVHGETVSADTVVRTPDEQNQMRPHEPISHSRADGQSLCSSTTESNICKRDGSSNSDMTAEKVTTPANTSDSSLVTCDEFKGTQSAYTSQREAALMKFRLKRKDRCYDKKVRYESRKRLAEQRPRVKGQFVRQLQTENSVNEVSDCL